MCYLLGMEQTVKVCRCRFVGRLSIRRSTLAVEGLKNIPCTRSRSREMYKRYAMLCADAHVCVHLSPWAVSELRAGCNRYLGF
jgi:hypothetical protein